MENYIILVDSTSDMSRDLRELTGVDYCKMGIVVDGKELPASLDWESYSSKDLYGWLRQGIRVFTTQVARDEFVRVFTKYLEQELDIIYIGCSGALSGSVNTAKTVWEEMKKSYPNRRIACVDSLNASLGQGMIAFYASNMKKEGKSFDEVVAWVEENKLKINQFVTVESLTYLKNAGRVKATSALFGNIFGVKPIIISDAIGQNFAVNKIKGRRASMIELVNMAKDAAEDIQNQTVFIVHADCEEDAEFFKELVQRELKPKAIMVNTLGPIIGATAGPGTIGIYVFGKKVTENEIL